MNSKIQFVLILILNSISMYAQEKNQLEKPIFSRFHTLSIHTRDTVVHDSVFHFLKDKLRLPVYYNPITIGSRKYAGLFAGNLILEPCGPYSEFRYATSDFKAMFFGLTFEPARGIAETAKILRQKSINHEVGGGEFIFVNDSLLSGENIYISIMDKHEKEKDHHKLDSLKLAMKANQKLGLGIEYVNEIQIGYPGVQVTEQWKNLISPSAFKDSKIWNLSNELNLCFLPGPIKEVKAIVLKVRSLRDAVKYLTSQGILFTHHNNRILLDKSGTFGLTISMVQ